MITVLLADGFEEIEALTPVDILRRAGHDVVTLGVTGKTVKGSHGISVVCDVTCDEINVDSIDMAVFPGGMPGALNLDAAPITDKIIKSVLSRGGRIAAICAAPLIFGRRGLLAGKRAICFPGFESELVGAEISSRPVVTDGQITTARGMDVSLEFAKELCALISQKAEEKTAETIDYSGYAFPDTSLLTPIAEEIDKQAAEEDAANLTKQLERAFDYVGGYSEISTSAYGRRLVRFNVTLKKPFRKKSIDDIFFGIFMNTSRQGVMVTPIEGSEREIAVEMSNANPKPTVLRELLESAQFLAAKNPDTVCIGAETDGTPVLSRISEMSHTIVAGATGMGKSVFVNSLIASLLYKAAPDELKLVLIDPKMVEFSDYEGLAHLGAPVITSTENALSALEWALEESARRRDVLTVSNCSVDEYNATAASGAKMPRVVIVIDELADLMLMAKEKTQSRITKLMEIGHTVGIHTVICTQRPSTNVLTAAIRRGAPTRVCFKCASKIDSRTVLDSYGAELLINGGDMLYVANGETAPVRLQSAYVPCADVSALVSFVKASYGTDYIDSLVEKLEICPEIKCEIEENDETEADKAELAAIISDEQFLAAAQLAAGSEHISTSLLQRRLMIGYGKAARYLDIMCELELVAEPEGAKPRRVLLDADEWNAKLASIRRYVESK